MQLKSAPSIDIPSTSIHADRLIIVTNRGPIEYYVGQDNMLKHRLGTGGVVTALLGMMNQIDATWFALAMTDGDRLALKHTPDGIFTVTPHNRSQKMRLHYVTVPKKAYHYHYNVISNQVLWFVQHYLSEHNDTILTAERFQHAWENGYVKVNQAIARAIDSEITKAEIPTVIMFHDYHLYLAPALIRARHPSCIMQHFIHIPWPEVRYWLSFLPTQMTQAIYYGLLGNDIIGFQTQRDAQNFLEGVSTLLHNVDVDRETQCITWQGHQTIVRDYPISISVEEERRLVQSAAGKRASEHIRPLLNQQTIMRVDRIEPTKNIMQGFQAYRYLLEKHPELDGKVTFLAFLIPSRQSLAIYQHYKDQVLSIIKEINQAYGHSGWTPIHVFVQNDRIQALAALQWYDVLLVNSLFDGMNLVAKEGPIVNQKDGVLVLSRTSGAFQQLEHASLPISPADTVETAEALYKALTMSPEERHLLATEARKEIETNNLKTWITQQVRDINLLIEQRSLSSC